MQIPGDGVRGNIQRDKTDKDKFHRLWCAGGFVVPKSTQGEITWRQCTLGKGV